MICENCGETLSIQEEHQTKGRDIIPTCYACIEKLEEQGICCEAIE